MAENTIQITEESAIIPLKTLNMYKGLEKTLSDLLRGEKFFRIITWERGWSGDGSPTQKKVEICVYTDWEAKIALDEQIQRLKDEVRDHILVQAELRSEIKLIRENRDTLSRMYRKYKRSWKWFPWS